MLMVLIIDKKIQVVISRSISFLHAYIVCQTDCYLSLLQHCYRIYKYWKKGILRFFDCYRRLLTLVFLRFSLRWASHYSLGSISELSFSFFDLITVSVYFRF